MLGAINHIAITVKDLAKSDKFYKPIMDFLGYKRTLQSEELSGWESESTGIGINFWQAKDDLKDHKHIIYAPGLHHIAFHAAKKEQVDEFYQLLLKLEVEILDPPAEYDYSPGYYAVFFKDINGFKIELTYMPDFAVKGPAQ